MRVIAFILACLTGAVIFALVTIVHLIACGAAIYTGLVFILMLFSGTAPHWSFWLVPGFIVATASLCLMYETTGMMSSPAQFRTRRRSG
jgi:hypothetical protein